MNFLNIILLGLSCVSVAFASPTGDIEKRSYTDARMTYYEVGLGACGHTNNDNQYVVALNSGQYDSGQHCNKKINISYGGKSATATIVDECPGCPNKGLDLSPALFKHFAPLDKGVIYGTWNYEGNQN